MVNVLLTEFDEKKYIKMERQDAYADGVREGTEYGYKQGIRNMVSTLIELGISKEEIINQVVSKFDVTKEQALEYIDKYDKVFRN